MKLLTKTLKKIIKKKDSLASLFALIFFTLTAAITIYSLIFNYWYQGRIFPGIYIAHSYVGGKTPNQAYQILNQEFYKFEQAGFTYLLEGKPIKVSSSIISPTDPDLGYEIISPKTNKSIQQAMRAGRKGPWWKKIYTPITLSLFKKEIPFNFTMERAQS